MKDFLKEKIGQPVSILCARYCYAGTLAKVEDTYCILTNPWLVEQGGAPTGKEAIRKDIIPSELLVAYAAIEQVCQPTWVFNLK